MTQTAKNYGNALYELARDEGLSETVLPQLAQLNAILAQEPDYLRLLSAATLSKEERCALLDEALRGRVEPYLLNFLKLLCETGHLRELKGCERQFRSRWNEDHGVLEATAVCAAPLTPALRKQLAEKLAATTGKQVDLQVRVDPSLLGGVRLEMDGVQLDGTVKHRLDELRRKLNETVL